MEARGWRGTENPEGLLSPPPTDCPDGDPGTAVSGTPQRKKGRSSCRKQGDCEIEGVGRRTEIGTESAIESAIGRVGARGGEGRG